MSSSYRLLLALVAGGLLGACSPDGSPMPLPANDEPPIVLDPPAHGYQLSFGPFSTLGADTQLCRTVKLDNEKPIAINKFELKMLAGSHHFILFRGRVTKYDDGTEKQVEYPDNVFDCKGTINFDEWDFLLDVNKSGGDTWELADGQAMVFPPHAQLMMQSHFVNSQNSATEGNNSIKSNGGYSVLNLSTIDMSLVKHKVRGMFTVNTRLAIPPHTEDWSSLRRCSFSRTVNIIAMTGHFHQQGRTFRVNQMDMRSTTGEQFPIREIYCSGPDCTDAEGLAHNWDSPLFKRYPEPILVNGGSLEGVLFSCSYDNYTDKTLYFGGLAATQEHCNLFFQYYLNDSDDGVLQCDEGSGGW